MKKHQRITSAALAAILLLLTGCGSGADGKLSDTSADTDAETTLAEPEGYTYPDKDYEGYNFRILNLDFFGDCYVAVDIQEQTGESVDDAVYNRNRRIEERFNITIEENKFPFVGNGPTNITTRLMQSVMAGSDDYDTAYLPIAYQPGVITSGCIIELYDVPGLNLDREWWDGTLNESCKINGSLYAASSPLQLTSLDLSWVLLFNKDMFDSYNLDYPYDYVRNGEWTLDKMNEYISKLANLNGDDSFTYTDSGNSVYGIAAHGDTGVYMMMLSAGERFVGHDKNGQLVYNEVGDRFYNVMDKLTGLFNISTGNSLFNSNDGLNDKGGYYNLFYSNRAAFLTTELKGTKVMRSLESDYGILPAPKYDEDQSDYITYASENMGRMTIPATVSDPERSGIILDALSYESMTSVLPLYYNNTISQKGLRDEDSIEMLEIINRTRMTEPGKIYGFTNDLVTKLSQEVQKGGTSFASIIASNSGSVKQKIEDFVDSIG